MSVTRTPLTPRSITSADPRGPSSACNRWVGSSSVASTSSSDVSRSLGVEDPCREHPAIRPPCGQQLARTQGGAAGGVKVTMDRGEEQAHAIPGSKAVMISIGSWFRQNEPIAIALMPSRRDHLPETLARVGQFCRKLSMSGSCGWPLTNRCETQTRAAQAESLATSLKRQRRALNDMYIRTPFAGASGW
jgi:hypothetical protein